jgi:hypothetical protein
MDEHVETDGRLAEVEELGHQDEVAGTRHRKKLGEPLHHAQYQRFEYAQSSDSRRLPNRAPMRMAPMATAALSRSPSK